MHNYRNSLLERRIACLEKYIYEKTMGRGQNESTAFTVWKWLLDNGPSTREQVRAEFNTSALRFLSDGHREGAVIKNGKYYSANPDYEWEDVGKVNYKGPSTNNITAAFNDIPEDMLDELNNQSKPRVKPNLYSDNIEEVKAAVESGQDVNSKNYIGRTALEYICSNYNMDDRLDIVKYLVKNGADLTTKDYSLVLMSFRYENEEIADYLIKAGAPTGGRELAEAVSDGLPVPTICLLIKDNLDDYAIRGVLFNLRHKLNNSMIHAKDYTTIVSKILKTNNINKDNFLEIIDESTTLCEVDHKITLLSDYIVNKFKVYPFIKSYSANFSMLNNDSLKIIFNYAKNVSKLNLKVYNIYNFIESVEKICKKLGKDFGELNLNEKFFKTAAKTNPLEIGLCAKEAYINSDKDLLTTLIKCGNMRLKGLDRIDEFGWNQKSDSVNRLYIKLLTLNKCKIFSDLSLEHIGKVASKLIVEYIIDVGLGERMVKVCKKDLSDQAKEALTEAGINFSKIKQDTRKSKELRQSKDTLISLIESDDSFKRAENILKSSPELLENPEVIDAINDPDNDHSFTARELRKRLPKEDSTYDF